MKTTLRYATAVATLAALGVCAVSGQAQQRSRGNIAVIDVSKIFKEHQRFRGQLDDMKKDVDTAEAALRKDRDEIKAMHDQLQRFNPGSPDYKRLDEQIATRSAQLQLKMNFQKKEFMEREAKIYFNVYKEIEATVKHFAQPRGIDLVLRYNDVEMDAEDRNKILAGVNKAVVYHNNIDITYDILDLLNRPQDARRPAPQGFVPPGPR